MLCSPGSGSLFPLGSTRVGCTASDTSGNTAVAFFTVSVVDTTPPKLTAPAAIVVAADSASGTSRTNATVAAFLGGAVATDLVTAAPTITTNAPDMFPVGTTQVVFTATDASGNKATATSNLTVQSPTTTGTGTTTTTPAPNGSVLWRGDAETGNFSQWTGGGNCEVQAARVLGTCYPLTTGNAGYGLGDGDIQIVGSPTHGAGSTRAYKHVIYQSLNGSDGSIRADLYTNQAFMGEVNGTLAGQEQYWHEAFLLPSINGLAQRWANYYEHNVLADVHYGDHGTSLNKIWPVAYGVRTVDTATPYIWFDHGSDVLPDMTDNTALAPLLYDVWYDVVFYIKWGTTASTGHVTVWVQYPGSGGYVQKFDKSFQTMEAGDHPYWKQALYSGTGTNTNTRTWTNTAVFDGDCRGTTFAAVATC